jgi:hypothetical protein
MTEYNYYREQLNRVKGANVQVKITSDDGCTNCMRLNEDSARELKKWMGEQSEIAEEK